MTTQARELAKIVTNAGDLSLTDDVTLASDASVLNFGADSDVTLTHVADTGLLLNSSRQLQFGDSGTFIRQEADGVLDLTSDTEIELNATTLDINANVDISGTLTVAGALDFGDLDISNVGSIALDTITNDGTDITLDSSGDIILDADGANVKFKDNGTTFFDIQKSGNDAQIHSRVSNGDLVFRGNDGGSTITPMTIDMSEGGLVGIGTTSPSAALHVVSDSTSVDALYLESTEASSSAAPILSFKRHSGSPADADYLGQIKFKGENDADQDVVYAKVTGKAGDVSDGSEDGILEFANIKAGSATITARLKSDKLSLVNSTALEVAIDEDIQSILGRTAIGFVSGLSDYAYVGHLDVADSGGYALVQSSAGATFLNAEDGQDIRFLNHGATKMTMASDGKFGIGTNAPEAALDIATAGSTAKPLAIRITNAAATGYAWEIWRDNTDGDLRFGEELNDSDTTRVTFESGGNVGIGTTSPGALLDIAASTNDDYPLKIRGNIDNSGGYTGIVFGYESDTTAYEKAAIHVEGTSGNVEPDFHILLHDGANNHNATLANAQKFSILNDGHLYGECLINSNVNPTGENSGKMWSTSGTWVSVWNVGSDPLGVRYFIELDIQGLFGYTSYGFIYKDRNGRWNVDLQRQAGTNVQVDATNTYIQVTQSSGANQTNSAGNVKLTRLMGTGNTAVS